MHCEQTYFDASGVYRSHGLPICTRIDSDIFGFGGIEVVQYSPHVLINFQVIGYCRFTVKAHNQSVRLGFPQIECMFQDLLAHRTSPGSSFRIDLQVGFQIEALNVFTFLPSSRQSYSLKCNRTFQRNLKNKQFNIKSIVVKFNTTYFE